jgi:GNAT superfamily N-acetyltransferase
VITFAVRNASREDASIVVELIRAMVTEMASFGGYPPATDSSTWNTLSDEIADELSGSDIAYLLAVAAGGEIAGLGGARLITLAGAFAPKTIFHIDAIFVRPHLRRQGIGDALMTRLLEWGAGFGALECDLNVLLNNPAQALYNRHGFSTFELKMVRRPTKD